MSEHPNAAFARSAFDAMGRGDTDWLFAHMDPEVVLHQGGRFPTAGTHRGRDAVFGHMMEFFTLVDFSMKTRVHDIAATDEHTISLVQVSIDFQGRHLDFDEAHVWHVRDGKAVEMWAVPKDPYTVDEFFAGT
ncbi:MAG TPA: nuclear transport factor 2 family protein [Acidimicrobiales bacterium]